MSETADMIRAREPAGISAHENVNIVLGPKSGRGTNLNLFKIVRTRGLTGKPNLRQLVAGVIYAAQA
jgi:hypothetical protein